MYFGLHSSRKGNFEVRLEWGTQLELSAEDKIHRGRTFRSTLNSTYSEELCFLSSVIWKHLFLPGCILKNEIFWCSWQSDQWITFYHSAHSRDHSQTRKRLALMSWCLLIFWICGIYSLETNNWSITWDFKCLVLLHVEGIFNTFSVAQNIILMVTTCSQMLSKAYFGM